MLGLNAEQCKVIKQALFGATGPIAWVLTKYLGLSTDDTKMWLDTAAALTPVIATVWMTASRSGTAQVNAIRAMTDVDKARAFASAEPDIRVAAAASVEGATVVVDTKTAPPAVTDMATDPRQPSIIPTP